jgi:hypothetical protein
MTAAVGLSQATPDVGLNRRMEQTLEVAQGGCIGEDDRTEGASIDPAGGGHQARPEALDNPWDDWTTGRQELVDQLIGVDVLSTEITEHRTHRAFATADVAGQADPVGQSGILGARMGRSLVQSAQDSRAARDPVL